MFSLIVTVVAVVLVSLLALATIYYGGQYVADGQSRTTITKVLQEGNQVVGALELYKSDNGAFPTGTSDEIKTQLLASNYLTQIPDGNWVFQNDYAVRTDLSQSACLVVNQRLGLSSIPACSDPAYAGKSYCCSM